MAEIKHGTRGGYYAHRRRGDRPCKKCRAAINEYVKEYRERKGVTRNRLMEAARREAMNEIRDNHRAEYEKVYARIKKEKGL